MTWKCIKNGDKFSLFENEKVSDALELDIKGVVGIEARFDDIESSVKGSTNRSILLRINSQGGDYLEALRIFNLLRSSGKKIKTYIETYALSAGAVLALAGDEIIMNENAMLFFHAPRLQAFGNKNADELSRVIDMLRACENTLIKTIVARTGKTEEECKKIVDNETWYTASEALEAKLIDSVVPLHRRVVLNDCVPYRIVAYVSNKNKELEKMELREVCAKIGITDVTNENAETKLFEYISSLKKPTEKPKANIPDKILNLLVKGRESEIDCLLSEGKITAAVATKLKTTYGKVTAESISEDGTVNDAFDSIVDTFKANEPVVNFGSGTGTQRLPNNQKDAPEVNPLEEDMERRSKK